MNVAFETCVKWGHIVRAMRARYTSETNKDREDALVRLSRLFTQAYNSEHRASILEFFNFDYTAREQEYFYDQIEKNRDMQKVFLVAQQGAILCIANFLNRFAKKKFERDLTHLEISVIDDIAEAIHEDIKERANSAYQADYM